MVAESVRSHSV